MDIRARFDDAATAALHLFADHLDAALAYCEDIAGARCERTEAPAGAGLRALSRRAKAFETFAGAIREREIAVLLRLQQARVRARELIGREARLDPVLKLFLGGTAALADAAELMTIEVERHAEAGGSLAAYLRSRGVATSSLAAADDLTPGEAFVFAGLVPLSDLMDRLAGTLDKLDLMYGLYVDAVASGLAVPAEPVAAITDQTSLEFAPLPRAG